MTIEIIDYIKYWKDRIHNEFDESIIQQIEKFDSELTAADFSINTRQSYLTVLHIFFSFVQKPLDDITKDDMTQFLNHLISEGKKLSTRKLYNRKIAKFFKWYSNLDLKVKFPKQTKEIELPDWTDKLPTMDEIEQMLAICDYPRDSAFLAILVESGSRINEVLRMRYKDVKVNDVYIRITLRPRKTTRDIPLVWSSKYIMQWLDFHPTKQPNDPLWPRKYHNYTQRTIPKNIDYRGAFEIIQRLKGKAGIERDLNPHLFRHLRATILAKDPRISPEIKKAYLGHSPYSNVFEKTYTHLSHEDVVDGVLHSFGLKQDEKDIPHIPELKSESCPRCNAPIAKNDKYCSKCWCILDQEEARKHEEAQKKPMEIINKLLEVLYEKLGPEGIEDLLKESQ